MDGGHRDPASPERPRPHAVEAQTATALLEPGGAVAGALPGYEQRPEQLQMLAAVTRCFNDDEVLAVEAGTGTGKSIAYLVPAILWSLANGERVVISTQTINLQEQLVHKDIPALASLTGLECTAVLVKGRGNYLCKRKAAQVEAQQAVLVEGEHERELRQVLDWARTTGDGSLADLAFAPSAEVWEKVESEHDNCLRGRCPFFSECFFYSARRAAAKADLLVVNHHLLMADLALRAEIEGVAEDVVLPRAARVVIDEAHHLEDVATHYFGERIGELALERTLRRLQSGRRPERGVLPALALALDSVERADLRPAAEGAARLIEERLLPRRQSVAAEAKQAFQAVLEELRRLLDGAGRGAATEKIRVTPALTETPFWEQLGRAFSRLSASLLAFADDAGAVLERLDDMTDQADRQVLYLATELRALRGRLLGFAAATSSFVEGDERSCRWIELSASRRGAARISFEAAPIEVGPHLRAAVFERMSSVVLTSATLAIGRRFDYLHRRLGLEQLAVPERVRTVQVDSPFDFASQAVLAVPVDLPAPAEPGFEEGAHDFIAELLRVTGGGTFVLFTSHRALERAHDALARDLAAAGLRPLRQSGGSRRRLLEEFVADRRSVLFATDSFWEGVDVRGDALRCVVIARLPFAVPTEPIQEARYQAIEARGGDAFADYSLPRAAIKLKQGFGRLIRSRADRGAVVLLDNRVVRRRYGQVLLDALPPARRLIASRAQIAAELARFYADTPPPNLT